MNWYQEAMIARPQTRPRQNHYSIVEGTVAWLFLVGWAMAIVAEVAGL